MLDQDEVDRRGRLTDLSVSLRMLSVDQPWRRRSPPSTTDVLTLPSQQCTYAGRFTQSSRTCKDHRRDGSVVHLFQRLELTSEASSLRVRQYARPLTCKLSLTPSFSPLPRLSSPAAPTSNQMHWTPCFSAHSSVAAGKGAGVSEMIVLSPSRRRKRRFRACGYEPR